MKSVLTIENPYKSDTHVKKIQQVDLHQELSSSINMSVLVEKRVEEIVNGMDIDPVKAFTDEKLPIYWDEVRKVNYVLLRFNPRGDLTSLICHSAKGEADDFILDGKYNIAGNRVDFLQDTPLTGYTAEARYII